MVLRVKGMMLRTRLKYLQLSSPDESGKYCAQALHARRSP